ncbi:hypothetical protein J3R82DRAFT_5908 [Butyriboletus roseoflavus]|nr:hypothetical protein J3R82DRAFT_5908 [Butyriboletus roseoflavus]
MDIGTVEYARGSLVLVVNDDMDERSELRSSMCEPSVDVSDPSRSQPAHYRLHDGLAPSPTRPATRTPSPSLPDIPAADLDLTRSFDFILGTSPSAQPHVERVQKRASNVLKLTQENEKLKEELRAMTARLEAAERRRQEIAHRQQQETQQQQQPSLVDPARSQHSS